MRDKDRYCPECGRRFPWYEDVCDECREALVDRRPGGDPMPEAALVPVFQSTEAGAIGLAKAVLEQEGLDYLEQAVEGPVHRALHARLANWTQSGGGSVALLVVESDAARARDLLADLARAAGQTRPAGGPEPEEVAARPAGGATILLHDAGRGRPVGRINEAQLAFLLGRLEQESADDHTYYVDGATIDMLADAGADGTLVNLLRHALAGRDGVEISWSDANAGVRSGDWPT